MCVQEYRRAETLHSVLVESLRYERVAINCLLLYGITDNALAGF